MEKDGNTHYWEYRWGDKCYEHLAELYEARRKFRDEFMFNEPDEPKKKFNLLFNLLLNLKKNTIHLVNL